MNSTILRRALVGITVMAAVAFLAAPAALAQPAPASNPVCGGVAGLMHHSLADYIGGAVGRNFVSIQRVSPINGSPNNLGNNGFHKICNRLGLTATGNPGTMADIDGDAVPDNADLFQFNGRDGIVNSYRCDQVLASGAWDEGSAVEIRPGLSNSSSVSLFVPGVECSQRYAVYESGGGRGINYFPIPLSTTCSDRVCLCAQLNLPNGTNMQTIDAAAGSVEDFLCGSALDPFTRGLPTGEAARIEPRGSSGQPAGAGANCIGGFPCPSTPSNTYPAPLIY